MIEKEKVLTNRFIVFLAMLFICLLWGSAYPAVKIGYELLQVNKSYIPSIMLFAGIRFLICGIMLCVLGLLHSPGQFVLERAEQGCVLLNALFQVVGQYFFYYLGLARVPGTRAAILNSSTLFFAIFIAVAVFRTEKYTILKLVSSLLAVASVVILNYVGNFTFSFSFTAEGYILMSSFMSAIALCLQKPFTRKIHVLPLCAYSFLIGGAIFSLYGFFRNGRIVIGNTSAILILIYISLISAVSFSIQSLLLRYNDVSVISIYRVMVPIFGIVLSTIFLNEYDVLLRWNTFVSAFLMLCAIVMCNIGKKQVKDKL